MSMPWDEAVDDLLSEYKKLLGEVAYSWNKLHETLAKLFATIIGGDSRMILAAWHSQVSDRSQREMLRAAIGAVEEHIWERRLPEARKDLIWLLDRADSLASMRNYAIHAPVNPSVDFSKREFVIEPDWFSGNTKAKFLQGKNILDEFAWYTARGRYLDDYAQAARSALVHNSEVWPPKLPEPTRGQNRSRKASGPKRLPT